MISAQRVYLDAFLAPLAASLSRGDVTDLYINRPGELWLETAAGIERHENSALDDASLWRLARQIAAASDQGINREHPLLAATLPDGARVQICAPPATRGNVIVAIRKHSMPDLRLTDYLAAGAFAQVGEAARAREATDAALAALLASGNTLEFLSAAVQRRKTMVISGGTGTGKTTFLNALLKEAPANERFVLIEDTPEIQLHHQNAVGLVAVRGKLGEASVSPAELVEAALRLRPDRIIMGEVRGAEAISWLRAVGTGHPGSITTVHANSPAGAIEQLAMMSMSAGTELGRAELVDYIKATVDVFVQLGHEEGARLVTEIKFDPRANVAAAGPSQSS
ncbi:MAG: P-type DNA transfer ATPase VirB11 [Pseudomonadota bacterium]|nr:P-type DNA transfer ATPase VirB11 [Sphingomonas sp.]MDQ3479551.1 P-type DNA transfer ATPase VirB11 [Pseudomonadota bacterium]